eukprot:m.422198 g.422198  ORF g.422198 m.422198 type:complete len:52 (+) comp16852_c0_seq5:1049-1204(+)
MTHAEALGTAVAAGARTSGSQQIDEPTSTYTADFTATSTTNCVTNCPSLCF